MHALTSRQGVGGLSEVAKDVVALLRKCDLVDSMADEPVLWEDGRITSAIQKQQH